MVIGVTPEATSIAATTLPAPGRRPTLDRVDRVAVRGDEARSGTNVVGGGRDPQVGQLRVHARDHRVRPTRCSDTVDPLLRHPLGGEARVDDLEPDVAQLAVEPARAHGEDAPHLRVALPEIEGGRARGADDAVRRDRRPELGQPGDVVGAVVHRVVRDVHDVVAGRGTPGEDLGDARNGIGAAVHDAVEVDQEEQGHGPGC